MRSDSSPRSGGSRRAGATAQNARVGLGLGEQRLGQSGGLGERRLEQRSSLGRGRVERPGELGEQHLAGLEVGELADLGRGQRVAVEDATLDHEERVLPPKARSALAASTGSPLTKATAVGPVRSESSPRTPACSAAAILVRVFFTTA